MKLSQGRSSVAALIAAITLGSSCSSPADCDTRRDCPSDFDSGAGVASTGASGTAGNGGKGGGGAGAGAGASGTSGEGGNDSSAGSGGATPPVCDGTLSPDADACVISDEYGVFVAPMADEGSVDGSQSHPFPTLTSALAALPTLKKRVYICAADYAEPGTLEIPDRVSIYGGFSCDGGTWKYDSPFPAHLLPASPIGASITNAKVGVVIEDVRIDAAAVPVTIVPGSSFGLMVSESQGVVLRRVEIRAGKATAGKDGVAGAAISDGIARGVLQNGSPACSTMPMFGVASTQSVCGSKGGNGGLGYLTASGDPGLTGLPTENLIDVGAPNGGAGATQSGVGKNGGRGGDGRPGKTGENGALAPPIGVFSPLGYAPARGGDGADGHAGQGGGGGGASKGNGTCVGASGGAGGMGGCGGRGGSGATGGGASVAVFSWNSALTLDGCTLNAASGGAGGNGGVASAAGAGMWGGEGGMGSAANSMSYGGDGGDGGDGGNGGNGAGGTGGPSIALYWAGAKPTQVNACRLSASNGGKPGLGGRLGPDSAKWGPDGQPGIAEPIFSKETP